MLRVQTGDKQILEYDRDKTKKQQDSTRPKRTVQRPNAAIKERERLKKFNEHLEALQKVIPIKLPEGRKLHKKQTLQMACRYIRFLQDCLNGTKDWSDRRRFWCGTDEDHSMIEAIDAAEMGVQSFTSNNTDETLRNKRRHAIDNDHPLSNAETPPSKIILHSGHQRDATSVTYSSGYNSQQITFPIASHGTRTGISKVFNRQFPVNYPSLCLKHSQPKPITETAVETLSTDLNSSSPYSLSAGSGEASTPLPTPQTSPIVDLNISSLLCSEEERLEDVWTDINEIISENEPSILQTE